MTPFGFSVTLIQVQTAHTQPPPCMPDSVAQVYFLNLYITVQVEYDSCGGNVLVSLIKTFQESDFLLEIQGSILPLKS